MIVKSSVLVLRMVVVTFSKLPYIAYHLQHFPSKRNFSSNKRQYQTLDEQIRAGKTLKRQEYLNTIRTNDVRKALKSHCFKEKRSKKNNQGRARPCKVKGDVLRRAMPAAEGPLNLIAKLNYH